MIKISANTQAALADAKIQKNLQSTLSKILDARDLAVSEVPNWEELRQYARQVKAHTLSRLDHYLEELERKVVEQGGKVIWAETGQDALDFVLGLLHERAIDKVVKSKSMLTEEIHFNAALERSRIRPVETDLGEYIIQLAGEVPFHIVGPALHKSREEIAELFVQKLGMKPGEDVVEITNTARRLLREHFLTAKAGVTGVNFAVAETGTVVVVENEGNARLSMAVPGIHIALMGIEKLIPRVSDLPIFLKLLSRSATGQKITSYVDVVNGPRRPGERDGPREFYLILVDNGRSTILGDPYLRQTLACIRCGACQNICPVYQRIGGHAYGSTYQGPIGAILTPQLTSGSNAGEHPYASSLCGACYEVCPVKIEIPHILLKLRQRVQQEKNSRAAHLPFEKFAMSLFAWAMSSPSRYALFSRWARLLQKGFQKDGKLSLPFPPFNRWLKHRDLPALAPRSFRELYRSGEELS